MNDESMTKEQLLDELRALRKEVDRFRKAEAERDSYVKELNERGQFLTGILEASPIVFTITRRKDGRFMLVNPAHARESGYSPEEVLGKTSLELNMYASKADRDAFVKVLDETGELNNFEVQYRNKDGSVRDVLLFARQLVYGGEGCMLTASLPITERKQAERKIAEYRDHLEELVKERTAKLESEIAERKRAEEALRESEEKYSKFFHSNPQWLGISTLEDGCYVEVNDAVKEITGYGRDEVIGRTSKELGLWADYEERSRFVKLAKKQGGFREQEVSFIKKNGEPVSLLWSAATIEIMGAAYFISTVADITDRKRAEDALQQSEEKYRNIFNNAQVGIFRTRISDGKVLECNDRFARTFDYNGSSKRSIYDFIVQPIEN